ncbi:splicing factor, arginine/serine-rich 19-like [Hydra vulgaris]|uniref:splicing factor, arginine/serine-rich 19-like n=1 Tax=Hydra vulgaris TaxID=6087 RepID=UPI001F5E7D8D|nr:splicing factor, arginine/serine-rich 19-like [Hydra vulgaris]
MKERSENMGSSKPKSTDYLMRRAKVEEQMKRVLKVYFKNREITKEEYKNILKKAVPQVTLSDSPIIPAKIQSLMTKFVRKCKGQRLREDKKSTKTATKTATKTKKEFAEQQR